MMKLFVLVIICAFGTISCETHEQQKEYADLLIEDLEDSTSAVIELLLFSKENTDEKKRVILLQANSFNFDTHFAIDCLQQVVSKNEDQPVALQEIVLELNNITYALQKSFDSRVTITKLQLNASLVKLLLQANNLRKIIRNNEDHEYRSTVLRFLDDLVTAVQKLYLRAAFRATPIRFTLKMYVKLLSSALTSYIFNINSEDVNVHNDIVRYSSKFSSVISGNANILKDLAFTYNDTAKKDEVKEIVYSLGKISHANEEVLYNENSFEKIKRQFRVTVTDVSKQLYKMINAGFSDNGMSLEDENLIYIGFFDMYTPSLKLMRNLQKTVENYINVSSD